MRPTVSGASCIVLRIVSPFSQAGRSVPGTSLRLLAADVRLVTASKGRDNSGTSGRNHCRVRLLLVVQGLPSVDPNLAPTGFVPKVNVVQSPGKQRRNAARTQRRPPERYY